MIVRVPTRLMGAMTLGGAALFAVACGSSSSSSSATLVPPAATGGASNSSSTATSTDSASQSTLSAVTGTALDRCLVGSWKTDSVSGSPSIGGAAVTFSGGGGETLVIGADGSFTDDYAGALPIMGTGGGHAYVITTTGRGTGTVVTGNQMATIRPADPTTITQTVTQDGATIQNGHPPASSTATYACLEGGGFTVTTADGTTTKYVAG